MSRRPQGRSDQRGEAAALPRRACAGSAWAWVVVAVVGLLASCAPRVAPAKSVAVTAPAPRVLMDRTSPFGRVLVMDEGPLRVMRFESLEGAEQSAIVRGHPESVPIEYVRVALLGLAHHGDPRRLLMVGLGGGTFTTLVHRALPDIQIDAVDIDPVVCAAARDYFDLREDARYRVHTADAYQFLTHGRDVSADSAATALYDFIFLDTYAGEEIPAPLRSDAYFQAVRRRLTAAGVVAINVAELRAPGREAARAFARAFTTFDCREAPTEGNVVLFGATSARAADPAALLRWAAAWDARRATDFSLRALAEATRAGGPGCARALSRSGAGAGQDDRR